MAKLIGKPNFGMLGRLKPPLDFYYAYGTWIVRYYPPHIKQPGTPAQQATWWAMKHSIDDWNELGHVDREAWNRLVGNSMRTGKDFYYRKHLKAELSHGDPWNKIFVKLIQWRPTRCKIMTKKIGPAMWKAMYCTMDEREAAWYWIDEGYCIRGRKLAVKRILIEQFSKYVLRSPYCTPGYECWYIPNVGSKKVLWVTFRLYTPFYGKGRTGIYEVRRP